MDYNITAAIGLPRSNESSITHNGTNECHDGNEITNQYIVQVTVTIYMCNILMTH